MFKRLKNNKKANPMKLNGLVFPVLAALPREAIIAIIVLSIIVGLELIYLVYLYIKSCVKAKAELLELQKQLEEKEEPEEKPVVEEKPEPVPVVEPKPEPVVVPVVAPVVETRTIYNYSFKSRLHLANAETADRYNELKNYLLSYEGVGANMSWKQETFTVKGKMVVKLRLQGKTMRVYIGVDPAKYADTKYNIEDVSGAKTHETTPSLLVVRGPGILKHAMELVDDFMKEHEVKRNENYKVESFRERNLGRERLIEEGLIKVQTAEFIKKD